jgi:putative two-component system response regulator
MSDPVRAGKTKIMVVDDNITNLKYAKSALSDIYDVFTAPSPAKMFGIFDMLGESLPSLILLDINMPEINGLETIKMLKGNEKTRSVPVIFLTAKSDPDSEVEGLGLGAVDYVTKPFEPHLLRKRVEIHLTMESQRLTLEEQKRELQGFNENLLRMVEEKAGRVLELQGAILNTLADLVESRDDITGGHIMRTQKWLGILVAALQDYGIYHEDTADWDMNLVLQSSQLHDVGKISIRDSILMKPGRLTPEEFDEMKRHAVFGARIIEKIGTSTSEKDFLKHAMIFARTHHEKWDGSGYPDGLRKEGIPLQGRLMAIADVYDALISDRPYKKAFSHEDAVRIIIEGKGTHFDPVLTDVFSEVRKQFEIK